MKEQTIELVDKVCKNLFDYNKNLNEYAKKHGIISPLLGIEMGKEERRKMKKEIEEVIDKIHSSIRDAQFYSLELGEIPLTHDDDKRAIYNLFTNENINLFGQFFHPHKEKEKIIKYPTDSHYYENTCYKRHKISHGYRTIKKDVIELAEETKFFEGFNGIFIMIPPFDRDAFAQIGFNFYLHREGYPRDRSILLPFSILPLATRYRLLFYNEPNLLQLLNDAIFSSVQEVGNYVWEDYS